MKVLDTTFLIDMLRGRKETLSIVNSKQALFTTQINMYEVIRGLFLRGIPSFKFAEIIEMFESIRVLPLEDGSIIKAAEISSELIRKGTEISDCDCFTAGIALSRGIKEIVTRNEKHFKRIKRIKVVKY